jgi:hypothetical protein
MKTLIAAVTFAAVLAAPAFDQSANARAWKGGLAAPASAKSAYAASFNDPRRVVLGARTYARDCNVSPANPSYRTNCN